MKTRYIKVKHNLSYALHFSELYLKELASRSATCYHPYTKKQIKKDGSIKYRKIDNPNDELKNVQAAINKRIIIPAVAELPEYIHGSRRGKSIRDSMDAHLKAPALLSLDIEDCFPSISRRMVYSMFRDRLGYSPKAANTLTKLTTRRHGLPQGAPTSSGICNLVLAPKLAKIHGEARKRELSMTNYIDDIHISGKYDQLADIIKPAISILRHANLKENRSKLRIVKNHQGMRVMGGNVKNLVPTASRANIREVRHMIHSLRDKNEYVVDKNGTLTKKLKINVIHGKISSISLVNKAQGEKLKRMLRKKLSQIAL